MRALALALVSLVVLGACAAEPEVGDVSAAESTLTAAQRRARAAQIRDAAAAAGITQGYLLAGIADSETSMSQCWSELTWACQGPHSSECGGPVVAGAGDGPCSAHQGGLGMFQFDAGTYTQTLAREGNRILTVAGNTEAAVDFVVAMVIRSTHISGVSTRAEAIAWINGVRVGNSRWNAWITTVTHYYNGCAPGASCFTSRYARYRDHTSNIYDEFGASFWNTQRYAASYVHQTFPLASQTFRLTAGTTQHGYLEMRNTGTETWRPGHTYLGTSSPRDRASALHASDWVNDHRAATIDRTVAPGQTGRFVFSVRAPTTPGTYDQYFNLVEEHVTWFSDSGGPSDRQIQIRVTSVAPACPTGIGASWTCDGDDRVRCVDGVVTRTTCADGCAAGACRAPAPRDAGMAPHDAGPATRDAGSSGHDAGIAVVEEDAALGTSDAGVDAGPQGDGSIVRYDASSAMPRGGVVMSGGCTASPGRGSLAVVLAMIAIAFGLGRRRR
ncbi:MAG: NBR1-Ig-like domain-containing protein [Sandaracinus sp.]